MKLRILTALLAAIFMFMILGPVALAEPVDGVPPDTAVTEDGTVTENVPATDDSSAAEAPDTGETASVPSIPSGVGTVADYASDGAGRVFYTIITPDDHVFYLVVDSTRSTDNVYFLNAVTVDDLMALAEPSQDTGTSTGSISKVLSTPAPTPTPNISVTPTPEPTPATAKSGGNNMYMLIAVLAVIGGGALYYFKIYRPKHRGANSTEAEDYAPDAENALDDWDGDDDGGAGEN